MIREQFWRGNAERRVNQDERKQPSGVMIVAGRFVLQVLIDAERQSGAEASASFALAVAWAGGLPRPRFRLSASRRR